MICSVSKSGFDYSQVNPKDLAIVQKHAKEIRVRIGKLTPKDVAWIGERLVEVKNLLPHGLFQKWIATEFDWSYPQVVNFMNVAQKNKTLNFIDLPVSVSALYQLSASSVPDEAIAEAVQRAEAGETISPSVAKEIVKRHKSEKEQPKFDAEKTLEKVKAAIEAIEKTVPDECKEWFGEYVMLLGSQIVGRAELAS